ncbi:unnamed protein product [Arctogadus glacialis]
MAAVTGRVGVYLDRPAGTLSFYRVSPDVGGSSDTLTHIHTFQSAFTQDVGILQAEQISSPELCVVILAAHLCPSMVGSQLACMVSPVSLDV